VTSLLEIPHFARDDVFVAVSGRIGLFSGLLTCIGCAGNSE